MATMKIAISISFLVMALLVRSSAAVSYTVGSPNGGWDTTTDLNSWASSNTFVTGDSLDFEYTTNHDVTEVPKADYDSCQVANPINTYNGGSTVISLTSPGKRYFICTTAGHCNRGMKVEIDTVAASSSPPPATPGTPPPATPGTPPPATPATPPPSKSPATPPPSESPVTPSPKSDAAAPPPQAPSPSIPTSPASTPPPSPSPAVAESPKSSANKGSFGAVAALGLCTGVVMFLAF